MIVRKPYQDISQEFLRWLSANVDHYLIGEHEADEDIKTTHCHVMFSNLMVTNKALDKQRIKYELNGDVSRLLSRVVDTREAYDEDKLGVYILKGKEEINKSTSYPDEKIKEWVAAWTPFTKRLQKDPSDKKEKPVKYDEYMELKKDFEKYYEGMNRPHITLDGIRTWTMRWYWKRDGRMPPSTSYKRNAASIYVYAVEMGNGSVDCAFEELKNLWY